MVEQVVCFKAKLHVHVLVDGRLFVNGEVKLPEVRSAQGIPAKTPEMHGVYTPGWVLAVVLAGTRIAGDGRLNGICGCGVNREAVRCARAAPIESAGYRERTEL